ncbi:conserved hypothetical protein [Clostridioides difficile E24]|nr:hypothetical protein QOU_1159 [Clostridioides difficile Y202]CCL41889.1 conserved hypothetical protein [Clostridioides difficile E24]
MFFTYHLVNIKLCGCKAQSYEEKTFTYHLVNIKQISLAT